MIPISEEKVGIAERIGMDSQDSPEKKTRVRKAFFYAWTAIGFVILFAILLYLMRILALPISMLIWTLVIVFCLRGVVAGLANRGVNRLASTVIAYVLMFAILVGIGFLMFSPMFGLNSQFADLLSSIPGYINEISKWAAGVSEKYADFLSNDTVQSAMASAGRSLTEWASSAASGAADAAMGIGTGIANAVYAIGFALIIAFWVLLELPAMGREVRRLMNPKYEEQAEFLHVTFTRILGGYLKGTIIQCFIIGFACGILFAIIRIPNAPALGVITGVLNIIPIIGPWLGGIVAAITAVFVSPWTALFAILGTIVIQQVVYTFVSPKIMSKSVDIHPALTLIAMIFGSAIGGAMSGLIGSLVGMLFSIPAVAVMKACFIYYFERSTERQIVDPDGFLFKGVPSKGGIADPLYDATSGNAADKEDADALGFFSKLRARFTSNK